MKRLSLALDSMRVRLMAWVAAVIVVCMAVTFLVVYDATGTRLRSEIDGDLHASAVDFAHALSAQRGATPDALLASARGYATAQPYNQASTLLFALIPGVGSASNHPELFGSNRPDDRESGAHQAQENELGRRLLEPIPGYSTRKAPDVGKVRLYELPVRAAGTTVYVGAGEALTTVSRSQAGVARAFLLAAAITLVLALVASYLVGGRVSAPLRRLAGLATRVDGGDLRPRMPAADASSREVRVLSEAFNHMLDRLEAAFEAQREFVADASHELRTPLTVMQGQLEVLAADPDPSPEELQRVEALLQDEISRISRLVDDLLLLARSERTDFLRTRPVDLTTFVPQLWGGLTPTAERDFQLGEVPPVTLSADPDRLAQALRNLARNAIEHTTEPDGLVRLEVERIGADRVRFSVIDDGPGIPPSERDRVFERFHRTDASRNRLAGGAGLGLAIVRAIAEAHHGTARAGVGPGGARIEIDLPGVVASASEHRVTPVRAGAPSPPPR
ncbi:MAG: ATP-binding protein [Solirubrobacteraceae bacterium]